MGQDSNTRPWEDFIFEYIGGESRDSIFRSNTERFDSTRSMNDLKK